MNALYSSALVARGGSPQRFGRAGVSQISTNFERLREAACSAGGATRMLCPAVITPSFPFPSSFLVLCGGVGDCLTRGARGTRAHPHVCEMVLLVFAVAPACRRSCRARCARSAAGTVSARDTAISRRSQDPHALTRTSHEMTLTQRTCKTKSTQEAHTHTHDWVCCRYALELSRLKAALCVYVCLFTLIQWRPKCRTRP